MISPFPVFRFMVDGIVNYFHLTDAVVALEIRRVVVCIPEAELGIGENINLLFLFPEALAGEGLIQQPHGGRVLVRCA